MKTNLSAPWRKRRFTISGTPAQAALKANYNYLADAAGADVAARYLAMTRSNKLSGPIDNTGMFVELAGPGTGAALTSIYQDHAPQGDSEQKNSVGIGADWVCPRVRANETTVTVDGAVYTLPVLDVTRTPPPKAWWQR